MSNIWRGGQSSLYRSGKRVFELRPAWEGSSLGHSRMFQKERSWLCRELDKKVAASRVSRGEVRPRGGAVGWCRVFMVKSLHFHFKSNGKTLKYLKPGEWLALIYVLKDYSGFCEGNGLQKASGGGERKISKLLEQSRRRVVVTKLGIMWRTRFGDNWRVPVLDILNLRWLWFIQM